MRGGQLVCPATLPGVGPAQDLLVTGGRIAAVAPVLPVPPGVEVLDCRGCWVLPGLVQGHVHLGQTLFRGLAESRRLLPWLQERIWPLEAAHDEESTYWSVRLGAAECLLGGTTTVQDIGLGPYAGVLMQALADSGLRALAGKCLMDQGAGLPAGLAESVESCLEETEALGKKWHGAGGGRIRYGLNPRFLLSCSERLWRGVVELSERHGWPIHTHALEQREETRAVRALWAGRDELEVFEDLGVLARRLSIAHGVWLPRKTFPELARRRFSVVHCPGSNLKLGSGIARVTELRRAGVPVGIGTDGAACNNRLDLWEELRLAHRLQALRVGPEDFGAKDTLELALGEGARAIWWEELGVLEPGRPADLVVVAAEGPEAALAGAADGWARVLYAASPSRVRHVFVAGEIRVRSGELVGQDLEEIVREARRAADRVARRAALAPGP